MPVISRPIVTFPRTIDRTSYSPSLLSHIDNRLILIALALLVALLVICACLRNRLTIEDLEARANRPLALFTTLVDQLADLRRLRFSTLLEIATARVLDANDARATRRPTTTGGLSNPVSTAPFLGAEATSSWSKLPTT
ncbi:hypothetical protein DFH94DRAFT_700317 [Russula ochroleuca]|uniref:Uncharacterized protein n=1 Tax=Russula ochroleuca TaxID=152965 RepID=A0A9P5JU61_9AGAM|nr:hypothetical protein DFH94DRAFT_700317 [Russula ochroleuca]